MCLFVATGNKARDFSSHMGQPLDIGAALRPSELMACNSVRRSSPAQTTHIGYSKRFVAATHEHKSRQGQGTGPAALAADQWRELCQFLEKGVPTLIAEVEQLQRERSEAGSHERRLHVGIPPVPQSRAAGYGESLLLSAKQFAHAIGVTETCVRRWRLERKIKVVKLGRLVRIPCTEIQRLMDEGSIPVRPSQSHMQ